MIDFKKWLALETKVRLIVLLAALLLVTLQAQATVIKDVRIGSNDDHVRLVLEFDQRLTPSPTFSIDDNRLRVDLTGIDNDLSAPRPEEYNSDIVSLQVSNAPARRIEVVFSFIPATINTFSLTDPNRFIVDAFRPIASSAAGNLDDTMTQQPSIQTTIDSAALHRQSEAATPAGISPSNAERPLDRTASVSSDKRTVDDGNRNRLQQRLIAALIVTTSIIIALLFFLLRIEDNRKKPRDIS